MTFLKKASPKYLFYGFIALFLIGCANPVWWYRSPTSDYKHFDFDPTELNCIELTEEVIRVSGIISDIAAKLTEQADRDTGYAFFGFETNNPRSGLILGCLFQTQKKHNLYLCQLVLLILLQYQKLSQKL